MGWLGALLARGKGAVGPWTGPLLRRLQPLAWQLVVRVPPALFVMASLGVAAWALALLGQLVPIRARCLSPPSGSWAPGPEQPRDERSARAGRRRALLHIS